MKLNTIENLNKVLEKMINDLDYAKKSYEAFENTNTYNDLIKYNN